MRCAWALLILVLLVSAHSASAEMRVDVNEELNRLKELGAPDFPVKFIPGLKEDLDGVLAGRSLQQHIPDAKYRIAVFEFEDPDGTGLGSAVSTLIGREVLLSSGLQSLGVLRYFGSLEPNKEHPQSYFDKVDLVVDAQHANLAVWGMIRRDGDSILVDVQAQIPDAMVRDFFTWTLKLPRAMGGETLVARVWPTRMRVQRVRIPGSFAPALKRMVDAIDVVREAPDSGARVTARLPKDTAYSVQELKGDWAKFVINGQSGWVRRAVQCTRECAPLLATAEFVGALLNYGDGGPEPRVSKSLSRDTAVVARQLAVLTDLRAKRFHPARYYLDKWEDGRAQDFGAPYADVLALSDLATRLQEHRGTPYDQIRLSEAEVRQVATDLAKASQDDPRNTEVLDNLAVLFRLLGDERRAGLASRLSVEAQRTRLSEPSN